MSYILEALKKSQQERELEKVPTLATVIPASAGKTGETNRLLPLALLLAVLAILLALYAVLGGYFTTQNAGDQPSSAPAPLIPTQPAAPPPTTIATTPPLPQPPSAQRQQGSDKNGPETNPQQHSKKSGAPFPSPAETAPAGERLEAARPTAAELRQELREVQRMLEQKEAASAPPPKGKSLALEPTPPPGEPMAESSGHNLGSAQTLPDAVQQRLPQRRMSVLSYAEDPAKRFIILNSEKINEGNTGREGLTVVTIQPGGAILSFEGHLFFQPL